VKVAPATGLFVISALALVGDVVTVLTGHGTQPLFDSVVLAGLTAGAGITVPAQASGPAAPASPASPTAGQ
jgi:hypothetical protein